MYMYVYYNCLSPVLHRLREVRVLINIRLLGLAGTCTSWRTLVQPEIQLVNAEFTLHFTGPIEKLRPKGVATYVHGVTVYYAYMYTCIQLS